MGAYTTNWNELLAALGSACKQSIDAATERLDENDNAQLAIRSDAEELGRVLDRIVRAGSDPKIHRIILHMAFGAPGRWGYDHPIGRALSHIYSHKIES